MPRDTRHTLVVGGVAPVRHFFLGFLKGSIPCVSFIPGVLGYTSFFSEHAPDIPNIPRYPETGMPDYHDMPGHLEVRHPSIPVVPG